ncbi:hypothetical protein ACJ41O_011104 [Fusarium nematophilum]
MPPKFRLDHAGISVPNLEDAVTWYTEVLGMVKSMLTVTLDRSVDPSPQIFDVYPRSLQKFRMAYLGWVGTTSGLELFEFHNPRMAPGTEANFERDYTRGGFFHVAVVTSDLEDTCRRVIQAGGRRVGPTMDVTSEHMACYVEDRWGNIIELVSASFEHILTGQ